MKKYIKKIQYTLNKFYYLFSKLNYIHKDNTQKICANSLPKSGTNLLSKSLELFPGYNSYLTFHLDHSISGFKKQFRYVSNNQIMTAHLKYSSDINQLLDTYNFKKFFIYRDPRDVVVSNAHYITYKNKNHRLHDYFSYSLKNDKERIKASICGIKKEVLGLGRDSLSIGAHIKGFLPWVDLEDVLSIKFEDLIGPEGGGEKTKQIEIVKDIAKHLSIQLDDSEMKSITNNIFSTDSKTFRKGVIGDWKIYFDEEIKNLFKEECGEELTLLGYEKDLKW